MASSALRSRGSLTSQIALSGVAACLCPFGLCGVGNHLTRQSLLRSSLIISASTTCDCARAFFQAAIPMGFALGTHWRSAGLLFWLAHGFMVVGLPLITAVIVWR